jgi:hypothetical protein
MVWLGYQSEILNYLYTVDHIFELLNGNNNEHFSQMEPFMICMYVYKYTDIEHGHVKPTMCE